MCQVGVVQRDVGGPAAKTEIDGGGMAVPWTGMTAQVVLMSGYAEAGARFSERRASACDQGIDDSGQAVARMADYVIQCAGSFQE